MSDVSLSASAQREYFHVISIESLLVGPRAVEWGWGLSGFGRQRQASQGSRVEK